MRCHDCDALFVRFGLPVKCGRCHYSALKESLQPEPLPPVDRDGEAQPPHLHSDRCPPRPSVFHVGHGAYAALCIRHAWAGPTVTADVESDAMADAGEFACPLCFAEWQERQRPVRDGFMRFQALTKAVVAAGLLALLWAAPVSAEGILMPDTGRLDAPLTLGAVAPQAQPMRWGTSKKLIAFAILGQVLDLVRHGCRAGAGRHGDEPADAESCRALQRQGPVHGGGARAERGPTAQGASEVPDSGLEGGRLRQDDGLDGADSGPR